MHCPAIHRVLPSPAPGPASRPSHSPKRPELRRTEGSGGAASARVPRSDASARSCGRARASSRVLICAAAGAATRERAPVHRPDRRPHGRAGSAAVAAAGRGRASERGCCGPCGNQRGWKGRRRGRTGPSASQERQASARLRAQPTGAPPQTLAPPGAPWAGRSGRAWGGRGSPGPAPSPGRPGLRVGPRPSGTRPSAQQPHRAPEAGWVGEAKEGRCLSAGKRTRDLLVRGPGLCPVLEPSRRHLPHVRGLGLGRGGESLTAALRINRWEPGRAGKKKKKNVEGRLLVFGRRIKPESPQSPSYGHHGGWS